jgi:hypothetical protein
MDIQVTQDHMERGIQGEAGYCPIALAVGEVFWNRDAVWPTEVIVDWLGIGVETAEVNYVYWSLTPTSEEGDPQGDKVFIRRWIEAFDKGEDVQPFTFSLPLDLGGN